MGESDVSRSFCSARSQDPRDRLLGCGSLQQERVTEDCVSVNLRERMTVHHAVPFLSVGQVAFVAVALLRRGLCFA